MGTAGSRAERMRKAETQTDGGRTRGDTAAAMHSRTKQFALRVLRVIEAAPKGRAGYVMGRHAGTSVGQNYRAACRAKSNADFVAKMGIVEEEADEAAYWMELMCEGGLMERKRLEPLMAEANEIVAMVVASINTALGGRRQARLVNRGQASPVGNPQPAIRNPQ